MRGFFEHPKHIFKKILFFVIMMLAKLFACLSIIIIIFTMPFCILLIFLQNYFMYVFQIFKTFFQKCYKLEFKQFGSRSEQTLCWA